MAESGDMEIVSRVNTIRIIDTPFEKANRVESKIRNADLPSFPFTRGSRASAPARPSGGLITVACRRVDITIGPILVIGIHGCAIIQSSISRNADTTACGSDILRLPRWR